VLFTRYKDNPTGIRAFRFNTSPEWYQTWRFWLTAGAILLIAILLFFFIRYLIRFRKEKARSHQLTQSLQSIRAQLNPHFVFNALSSIQGLINKNNITNANHYLTGFSNLLRESLRNHDKEFVPLEKELSLLDTYISLEKLRFGFGYTIQTDHDINTSDIEIPYLLLQPVVENAIKHGAGPKNTDGNITIRIYRENADLHLLVTDNGAGFTIQPINGHGMGIRITKERISLLNRTLHGQFIHLAIKSTTAEGTTVHLTFQNWL
jgi:LytS/YehU family sensor histidine kinase